MVVDFRTLYMDRVVLAWSGGKDAAFALSELRRDPDVEVIEFLTTLSEEYDRSSMHGVRRELYDRQADAAGLPIRYVSIPAGGTNEEYEERMATALTDYRDRGIDAVAFADLYLEDVRAYRQEQLSQVPLDGLFPLWGRDTATLVTEILEAGFRATVVCVDGDVLDESFAGREMDRAFLDDLPDGIDPCGENGEFHTFVHDGRILAEPIAVTPGERVTREIDGHPFHYSDLLPEG